MNAAYIDAPGDAASIKFGRLPVPEPGPGQVRIRVHATAVNHVDTFVRSGAFPTAMSFPFVIGRDAVGVVEACGPNVDAYAVGDDVWCNSLGHSGRQGAAADYVVVDVERVYRLPAGVNVVGAAAVLHAGATAFLGLVTHGRAELGENVYIAGGGGAVGSAAISIAAARGATVIASASARDLDHCRAHGAAYAFDYHDSTVDPRTYAPDGVHVFFDTSGKEPIQHALDCLAPRGRVVLISGMQSEQSFRAGSLYTTDKTIAGFAISNARVGELQDAADAVNALMAAGRLSAHDIQRYPLDRAAEAHARLESGQAHGEKLVLIP